METKIAIIAIIVEDNAVICDMQNILSQYSEYIIGRMGIPHRERGIRLISVAVDAPIDTINALSGKIGRLEHVTAKTVYANV